MFSFFRLANCTAIDSVLLFCFYLIDFDFFIVAFEANEVVDGIWLGRFVCFCCFAKICGDFFDGLCSYCPSYDAACAPISEFEQRDIGYVLSVGDGFAQVRKPELFVWLR